MKERELRERCTCAMCGKKIGATGLPMFWPVEIKRSSLTWQPRQPEIAER